jgi:hypothetical protein
MVPYRWTDRLTDGEMDGQIHSLRMGWRNFFPLSLNHHIPGQKKCWGIRNTH